MDAGVEEEEQHCNPFVSSPQSVRRYQFRSAVSRARWNERMKMGEIIEKKGGIWSSVGVIRNGGKLYCTIEEITYNPPSRSEVENLERQCSGVPLKFCNVDQGRISVFSFERIDLPVLP